jgi:hypothetical protein
VMSCTSQVKTPSPKSAKTARSTTSVFAFVSRLLLLAALAQFAGAATPSVCNGSDGYADAFGGRRTFLLRPDWLSTVKARAADLPQFAIARKSLFARADAALTGPVYSVVDKLKLPPSKDKHDYMSIGPYWWPDEKQPGGEPYVRRDGKVNPERDTNAFDTTALESMSASVEGLTLAYYFSDDSRYAQRAAQLLRVWFLDPATRMNPNASFAQGIPGRTPGRAEGVLDTFRLQRVVEGIGLLAPSKTLTKAEQAGLEKWFSEYVDWMLTSPTGSEERTAANNHGLWYDYQLAQFALFARRIEIARAAVDRVALNRIPQQIERDGKMPRELERTRALHYSLFALQAAAGVADLAPCVGKDVWSSATADGRGLEVAIEFLLPYVGRESEFPYPDPKREPSEQSLELFSRAAWAYRKPEYVRAAAVLAGFKPDSDINLTIAPWGP